MDQRWRQYRILDWPEVQTEEDLGWPAGGHRGGFEVVGRRWDSTGFEVGRRWRQEDLGWPAGGGDRRLWVRTFWVTVERERYTYKIFEDF